MAASKLNDALLGVTAGPVSPFREDLALDLERLEMHAAELAGRGYCAILVAAGIAEFFSLAPDEVVESVRAVRRAVALPVIGTTGVNIEVGAELARRQELAGADALLVMPPYYPNAPEEGLLAYYESIGKATALPLIIYSRDWAVFTPEAVARLAERIPTLAGWKDGQGDIRRYQRIMRLVGDRLAWLGGAGDDCAPGYFAIGVRGFTSSFCNVLPEIPVRIAQAGLSGGLATVNALVNEYVHPLFRLRERKRGYEVAVTKKAMELLGHSAGPVRPPLPSLAPADIEELARIVAQYRSL